MGKIETHRTAGLKCPAWLRRLWCAEAGVSAIELAFVSVFMAPLIIGTVDYGLVYTRKMAVANAVRAGTQYAMIRRPIQGDVTAIEGAVTDAITAPKIGSHVPVVTLFCECSDGTAEAACNATNCDPLEMYSFVSVQLTEDFPLLFSYPGFKNPVTLDEISTMRLN